MNNFSIVFFYVRKIVDKTFPKSQTDCRLAACPCPCIATHNLFTISFSVVHCSFEYKMKMSFHVVIWLTPPAVKMPCNELVYRAPVHVSHTYDLHLTSFRYFRIFWMNGEINDWFAFYIPYSVSEYLPPIVNRSVIFRCRSFVCANKSKFKKSTRNRRIVKLSLEQFASFAISKKYRR